MLVSGGIDTKKWKWDMGLWGGYVTETETVTVALFINVANYGMACLYRIQDWVGI